MVYIENILWGLLVFPLIAAAFTLPYALYQYHKYGSVSKLRTLIIYSFILYMLIAFFMVCPEHVSVAASVAYFIFEVFRKEAIPMPHDRLSGTTYRSLNR